MCGHVLKPIWKTLDKNSRKRGGFVGFLIKKLCLQLCKDCASKDLIV